MNNYSNCVDCQPLGGWAKLGFIALIVASLFATAQGFIG